MSATGEYYRIKHKVTSLWSLWLILAPTVQHYPTLPIYKLYLNICPTLPTYTFNLNICPSLSMYNLYFDICPTLPMYKLCLTICPMLSMYKLCLNICPTLSMYKLYLNNRPLYPYISSYLIICNLLLILDSLVYLSLKKIIGSTSWFCVLEQAAFK